MCWLVTNTTNLCGELIWYEHLFMNTIVQNSQVALDIQSTMSNTDLIVTMICAPTEGVHQSWEYVCAPTMVCTNHERIYYEWVAPIM